MIKKYFCLSIIMVGLLPSGNPIELDNSDLQVNVVERLLGICFTNINRLVALSGNISQKLAEKIHERENTAVTRMSSERAFVDKFSIAKYNRFVYINEFYFSLENKAQVFVVAASSQPLLRHQLNDLRNSRWWSASGFFVIVDAEVRNDSCKNAQNFLWAAWRFNLLSTVYLCHDTSGRLTMFSYNPYNDMAPRNWIKVGHTFGRNHHRWILFKQNASNVQSLADCQEIFWKKTVTLDNYQIRTNAIALAPRLLIDTQKSGLDRYSGEEGTMIRTMFNFLNASAQNIPYTGQDPIGLFDENGTYSGMLADLFTQRVDFGINGRYMVHFWKLGMSYPYTADGMCLGVKSRGNMPQWLNLAFAFDARVNLGLVTTILFSTAVLIYYSSFSRGCLNGLRLLISATLVRPPSRTPAKLYFTSVLLALLITDYVFRGRLVSLLMKPRAYSNPETMLDLRDDGYKIVGYKPFRAFIGDPVLRARYVEQILPNFRQILSSDEKFAFIADCQIYDMLAQKYKAMHVLHDRMQIFHRVFAVSWDWPLLNRFDELLQRLLESGMIMYWRAIDVRNDLYSSDAIRSFEASNAPILTLQNLAFMFWWLLIGLFVATLVFLYEVCVGK